MASCLIFISKQRCFIPMSVELEAICTVAPIASLRCECLQQRLSKFTLSTRVGEGMLFKMEKKEINHLVKNVRGNIGMKKMPCFENFIIYVSMTNIQSKKEIMHL